MADEVTDIQVPVIDKVAESFWTGKAPEAITPPADGQQNNEPPKPPEDEFDLFDSNEYLKSQLGFDDWDIAKTEYETLKKIKENPFEETYKRLDDDSRKILDYIREKKEDDLLSYLQTRKVLSTVETLEPDAALKLYIQQVNKALNYTQQDVEDVFKEKYSIPKKPVQDTVESDEDFGQRENEWKEQKGFVERKIQRDSIAAKQELSKLLPTINLQDIGISPDQQKNEQAQKELEATQAKVKTQFDEILNSDFKNFNGLTINFKDDQTEIPVSFIPTDEQKATLKSDIENFDADEVLGSRWFDKDGKPNIQQAMMDMLYFKFGNQIFQKLVKDSGAKRLEAHVKSVKNVPDFTNGNQSHQTNGKPSRSQLLDAVGEALWTSHR